MELDSLSGFKLGFSRRQTAVFQAGVGYSKRATQSVKLVEGRITHGSLLMETRLA